MRNVVITGAGRGLGLEVTKAHVQMGDRVWALSHSMTEELQQLSETSENLTVLLCELTRTESVADCCQTVPAGIDLLYNIAGLYSHEQLCGLEGTDFALCQKMYDVNALGPLRVLQALKDKLSDGALVMNVSSEAGSIGQAGRSGEYGYCMSKAALNMGIKLFANEMAGRNIRNFLYHPGWIRTQMGGVRAAASPYSISAEYAAECILKLTLHPENYPKEQMYWDYEGNQLPW